MLHMVSQLQAHLLKSSPLFCCARLAIMSRHHLKGSDRAVKLMNGQFSRSSMPMSPLPCRCDQPGQGCSFPALIPPP